MKLTSRATLTAVVMSAVFGLATHTHSWAATITAASCSLSDVQAAVTRSVDGDTVLIPNGSCAWAGGISTNKQIRIEAQNYTPTKGGTMTRNVTITNNSTSAPLLSFTTGNSFHVGVAGIRFNEGSGNQNHVRFNGSGSKVPLVSDCAFEVKDRGGNAADVSVLSMLVQGGVLWNSYFKGLGGGVGGASILVRSPRGWNTPSTMGALDTSGTVNFYIEDSTLQDIGQSPDVDDNGRVVIRYSILDGSSGLTHGFTSAWGGRHIEYYNNTFRVTTPNRDIVGRYFWLRAGTVLFTENAVSSQYNGYQAPVLLNIGDNTAPTGYPQPRQPGWGHNGTTNVIDPIYIWNNSGNGGSTWSTQGGWTSYVQLNREIFINSGAKPGYSKYSYPHPLRSGSPAASAPPPPPQCQ